MLIKHWVTCGKPNSSQGPHMTQVHACGLLTSHIGVPPTPDDLNRAVRSKMTMIICTLNLGPLPHTPLDEGLLPARLTMEATVLCPGIWLHDHNWLSTLHPQEENIEGMRTGLWEQVCHNFLMVCWSRLFLGNHRQEGEGHTAKGRVTGKEPSLCVLSTYSSRSWLLPYRLSLCHRYVVREGLGRRDASEAIVGGVLGF